MSREVPRPPLELPETEPLVAPSSFEADLAKIGVTLDETKIAIVGDYLARLLAANELLNLTAIRSADEAWTRHALDALSLVPHLAHLGDGAAVMDVGSGGGVPGIVLAIARPDLEFLLVEATQKKAHFLEEVASALGLSNVEVAPERAEELAATDLAGSFDAVTARAVAPIERLLPWTAPFVAPGGRLLYIKGQKAPDELKAAKQAMKRLGVKHVETRLGPTGRVVVLEVA
ncbi:MAG: 16S rRNA (guanine(527)-N(7))-methyltransferase RsmG [Polyangiaceae bacterium]